MTNRPNTLNRQEVATALQAHSLFTACRDYFGASDEATPSHAFECSMEYEPEHGRIDVHLFPSLLDGGDFPPLFHLIAHFRPDGLVAPSVLELDGVSYNARRLSRESLKMLLDFVGEVRTVSGRETYEAALGRYRQDILPSVLEEVKSHHSAEKDSGIPALRQAQDSAFAA